MMAATCYWPVLVWAILLTDSRLGVVGYCLSLLFYLFIHGLIKWRSERRSLVGPAIILAYPLLFTGFIVSTFFVQRLNRMVWGGGAASYSTQARIAQYQQGLRLVMARSEEHTSELQSLMRLSYAVFCLKNT